MLQRDTSYSSPPYWEASPPTPGIFLNYRYVDVMAAVAIDTLLQPHFGEQTIFRADRSLKPNDPYKDILTQAVARASLMLAIVGQNWGRSLVEGNHGWALLELRQAGNFHVPILPISLTWTRNDHNSQMLWNPVEVPTEEIGKDNLPPGVPESFLQNKPIYFGTQEPEVDAVNISHTIKAIAPNLA